MIHDVFMLIQIWLSGTTTRMWNKLHRWLLLYGVLYQLVIQRQNEAEELVGKKAVTAVPLVEGCALDGLRLHLATEMWALAFAGQSHLHCHSLPWCGSFSWVTLPHPAYWPSYWDHLMELEYALFLDHSSGSASVSLSTLPLREGWVQVRGKQKGSWRSYIYNFGGVTCIWGG